MAPQTHHVGDPAKPVLQVIYVHGDEPVVDALPAWRTPAAVADMLGVSPSKVSRLIHDGALECRRIGTRVQIHVDAVARYEATLSGGARTSGRRSTSRADVARAARQAMPRPAPRLVSTETRS